MFVLCLLICNNPDWADLAPASLHQLGRRPHACVCSPSAVSPGAGGGGDRPAGVPPAPGVLAGRSLRHHQHAAVTAPCFLRFSPDGNRRENWAISPPQGHPWEPRRMGYVDCSPDLVSTCGVCLLGATAGVSVSCPPVCGGQMTQQVWRCCAAGPTGLGSSLLDGQWEVTHPRCAASRAGGGGHLPQ